MRRYGSHLPVALDGESLWHRAGLVHGLSTTGTSVAKLKDAGEQVQRRNDEPPLEIGERRQRSALIGDDGHRQEA